MKRFKLKWIANLWLMELPVDDAFNPERKGVRGRKKARHAGRSKE
jgi:hypothetical protein